MTGDEERRVRDRLTAHVEGHSVHYGCGGEVTGNPATFGVCQTCGEDVEWSDTAEPWELEEDRDVATLLVGIDNRDAHIAKIEQALGLALDEMYLCDEPHNMDAVCLLPCFQCREQGMHKMSCTFG